MSSSRVPGYQGVVNDHELLYTVRYYPYRAGMHTCTVVVVLSCRVWSMIMNCTQYGTTRTVLVRTHVPW